MHPDLLLGTDPDCDRCGTAVPDGKGGYRLITGNEMGIILLDYICRTRKALGTMPEHPVAVTTIVSTDMATPVAAKYGVELRRTLTGFKFIGEQIGLLEAAGEADRYIFGFEESYGYLSGAHVRDKDAVNATLLVCEAAAWYAKQGMTLLDAINQLYAEFGCYRNALHSFAFEGESGMHTMDAIMKQLRQTPPTAIGGMAVENVVDYNTAGTAKLVINTMIQKYGHDEGIQYLVDLDKNIEVYTKSGSGPSKNVGTGECVIGISFLSDGIARIEGGCTNLRLVLPAEGTPCRIAATAIFKDAAHPNAAKLWTEFALSPACVELAAANGCFQFPVLGNAQRPSTSAAGLDLRGVVALDRDESADVIDACIEETMTALAEAGADISAERFQTP